MSFDVYISLLSIFRLSTDNALNITKFRHKLYLLFNKYIFLVFQNLTRLLCNSEALIWSCWAHSTAFISVYGGIGTLHRANRFRINTPSLNSFLNILYFLGFRQSWLLHFVLVKHFFGVITYRCWSATYRWSSTNGRGSAEGCTISWANIILRTRWLHQLLDLGQMLINLLHISRGYTNWILDGVLFLGHYSWHHASRLEASTARGNSHKILIFRNNTVWIQTFTACSGVSTLFPLLCRSYFWTFASGWNTISIHF